MLVRRGSGLHAWWGSRAAMVPFAGWIDSGATGAKAVDDAAGVMKAVDKVGAVLSRADLSPSQLANLSSYTKKLPSGAEETQLVRGANAAAEFSTNVPGRVPGSYATYAKTVDSSGTTISYIKTTVAPDSSRRTQHLRRQSLSSCVEALREVKDDSSFTSLETLGCV